MEVELEDVRVDRAAPPSSAGRPLAPDGARGASSAPPPLPQKQETKARTEPMETAAQEQAPAVDPPRSGEKRPNREDSMIQLLAELEQEAEDQSEAEPTQERVLDVPAGDEDSLKRLEDEARKLMQACETELMQGPEPTRAARLHFEIARLCEMPLGDLRRAVSHYQEAHAKAPDHLPAIRGARRMLLARKRFRDALPLFDAEARITPDARRKALLYVAKGRVLEDAIGDGEGARQAYAMAWELDRTDPTILKATEQLDHDEEDWERLSVTLGRAANVATADPKHRSALILRRARVLEHRQKQPDAAIEMYESALRLDPEAMSATAALKRLHHNQRRWRDLIRVLEIEAESSTSRETRWVALYQVARLHLGQLGNESEALAAFERAAEEKPGDALILFELARLYESSGKWAALKLCLEQTLATAAGPAERLSLLERIARICHERLNDEDSAVAWYRKALELEPTHESALLLLEQIYTGQDKWLELAQIHIAAADAAEPAENRAASHARAGLILEQKLNLVDEAIEQHAKAVAHVPGYPTSFNSLARLLELAERWRDLVELHERAVDQVSDPSLAITYLFKIGSVSENGLDDPAPAIHAYRRILEIDGDHVGAIQALQRATERAGRYPELVEALELEADRSPDEARVIALLHRAGEILVEYVGDREAALAHFRKALGLNSQHLPSVVAIGRIYEQAGRFEDLLEALGEQLELTTPGPAMVRLLHRMGVLCAERIGKDDDAIMYFRRALDLDPGYAPTLHSLSRLLGERRAFDELVELLELERSGTDDAARKASLSQRIGELCEQLGEPERSVAAYEQALRTSPDYRPAIESLRRLRAQNGSWGQLVEELEKEAARDSDPPAAIAALQVAGEIWTAELQEPQRATRCYERILELEPRHMGALLALEPLYRRSAAWNSLAYTYATLATTLNDVRGRVSSLRELARLQRLHGSAIDGSAQDTYEAILRLAPEDSSALDALEALAMEDHDLQTLVAVDGALADGAHDATTRATHLARMAELLEVLGDPRALPTYRAALESDPENLGATRGMSRLAEHLGDPGALAEAARREAYVTSDRSAAARLLVKSARVRAEKLSDRDGARQDLEKALELSPDHAETAELLSRMLLEDGQADRLGDLLSRAASSTTVKERAAALFIQVADLQSENLNNVAGAISSLNRALRVAPNHVAVLRRLGALYAREGQWTEAVNLLSRVIQLAQENDVIRDAHLALAAIWDERLGESSRAHVSLQAVLALDPENQEALRRLAELQERLGKIDDAAATARRRVDAAESPTEKADALVHLGHLYDRCGNTEGALATFLEAASFEGPGGESALEVKSRNATPTHWNKYATALEVFMERSQRSGDDTTSVLLELARVRYDQMKQPEQAIALLHRGVAESARADVIRLELATRLRAAGSYTQSLRELQLLVEEEPTRIEAWRGLGRTFEAAGRTAECRLALMPLMVLDAATDQDLDILMAASGRPKEPHPAPSVAAALSAIGPSGVAEDAATELLTLLTPVLHKVYPPDLEAFGLSARDRITTKHGDPLRSLADRIADLVGAGEFELYLHRLRTRGMAIELGQPPALLVPASLAELPHSERVFHLAQPLVAVALRLHALDKLTPRELEVALASVTRRVSKDYGQGLTNEEELEEQGKRLFKALPRRTRKHVDEAAARYAAAPRLDFAVWAEAVVGASRRVASVLSNDLVGAVNALQRSERELASLKGEALVTASPAIADLLRFWVSEEALNLRLQLGLL